MGEINTKRYIPCSTVLEDTITVNASYTVGTRMYSETLTLSVVVDGLAGPLYIGAVQPYPK